MLQVYLRAIFENPVRYLWTHPDGRVRLSDVREKFECWEMKQNENGSVSFKGHHGMWLVFRED